MHLLSTTSRREKISFVPLMIHCKLKYQASSNIQIDTGCNIDDEIPKYKTLGWNINQNKSGKTSSLKYWTNKLFDYLQLNVITVCEYLYCKYLLTHMISISSTWKDSPESYMALLIYDFWHYFALYIKHICACNPVPAVNLVRCWHYFWRHSMLPYKTFLR